jgi:hypothetical protein
LRPPYRIARRKWGYGCGIWRGTLRVRLRLTWPRPALNWRHGTWPVTGGGVSG